MLSRVHWVRSELVVEVTYLTWTDDALLRQVVYEGLQEDKPARHVARPLAATETAAAGRGAWYDGNELGCGKITRQAERLGGAQHCRCKLVDCAHFKLPNPLARHVKTSAQIFKRQGLIP